MTIGARAALALAGLTAISLQLGAEPGTPRILQLDPAFDQIIAPGARIEKITDGHTWLEGPVWDQARHWLLFTDIPNNVVLRWREHAGVDVFLHRSGYAGTEPFTGREPGANGLTLDPQGRLVLAEHGDRRVTRLNDDGSRTVLADRFQGRRLNSPNDVVFDAEGNLYFTDPPFGLPGTFEDPARELDFCGVYRLSPDGKLTLLTRRLQAPNGIALSPDGRMLYATDVGSARPAWWVFKLLMNGDVDDGHVFRDAAPLTVNGPGGPDGLKLDRQGNIFASGPGGLYIFSPDGLMLGRVHFGVATSNLAWGPSGRDLFVTAGTAVYRIETRAAAASLPGTSG